MEVKGCVCEKLCALVSVLEMFQLITTAEQLSRSMKYGKYYE